MMAHDKCDSPANIGIGLKGVSQDPPLASLASVQQ